jgi:hypothetical protein
MLALRFSPLSSSISISGIRITPTGLYCPRSFEFRVLIAIIMLPQALSSPPVRHGGVVTQKLVAHRTTLTLLTYLGSWIDHTTLFFGFIFADFEAQSASLSEIRLYYAALMQ